jgi:hypothetical protein
MPDLTYDGLNVGIRERPDQGNVAEVGVIVEDAFIPFARVHLGDMHEAIHEAAKAKADEAEQRPEPQPEQPTA